MHIRETNRERERERMKYYAQFIDIKTLLIKLSKKTKTQHNYITKNNNKLLVIIYYLLFTPFYSLIFRVTKLECNKI